MGNLTFHSPHISTFEPAPVQQLKAKHHTHKLLGMDTGIFPEIRMIL